MQALLLLAEDNSGVNSTGQAVFAVCLLSMLVILCTCVASSIVNDRWPGGPAAFFLTFFGMRRKR